MKTESNLPEFRIAILNMLEAMPLHIEAVKLDARLKREKYLAFIAEGFDEKQALELTK